MDDHTGRVGDELHAEALSLEALLLARGYLYELFHKALGGDPTSELVAALTSAETLDVAAFVRLAREAANLPHHADAV